MNCKNLNDVIKVLTQNGYDLLCEFKHPLTRKTCLSFQALKNEDYDIAKIKNLIDGKFQCYKIYNRMNYREFVINKED